MPLLIEGLLLTLNLLIVAITTPIGQMKIIQLLISIYAIVPRKYLVCLHLHFFAATQLVLFELICLWVREGLIDCMHRVEVYRTFIIDLWQRKRLVSVFDYTVERNLLSVRAVKLPL